MKTKNFPEAFGTTNMSLCILGMLFYWLQVWSMPNIKITEQKLPEVDFFELKILSDYIIAKFLENCSIFIMFFGILNGWLSFFARYDWKS